MKNKIKIGVKFCGNCNPYFNTSLFLNKIKTNYNTIEFIKWDEEGYCLLLILNSCTVGCATIPSSIMVPKIIVKNDAINYETVSSDFLFDRTLKTIDYFIKKL